MNSVVLMMAACVAAADPVSRLGDDDFEVRERASAQIRKEGWVHRPALKLALLSSDPEVRNRAVYLLYDVTEAQLDSFGKLPMIDSLWLDPLTGWYSRDDELRDRLMPLLLAAGGPDGFPYVRYRLATRLLIEQWLDAGVDDATVRDLLTMMHVLDLCWWHHAGCWHGHDVTPLVAVRPWMRPLVPRIMVDGTGRNPEAPPFMPGAP